jgi:hypothetical protein
MSHTNRELSAMEWQMARAEAERADCPRCAAEVGQTCVNLFGDELKAPAHFQRLDAAKELP